MALQQLLGPRGQLEKESVALSRVRDAFERFHPGSANATLYGHAVKSRWQEYLEVVAIGEKDRSRVRHHPAPRVPESVQDLSDGIAGVFAKAKKRLDAERISPTVRAKLGAPSNV